MISTRGRYALRVMIDLAENHDGKFIPMKDVAARQDISLKYIGQIMPALVSVGMVESIHGKGGGYRLKDKPEQYKVVDILRLTEGNLAPVSCLECGATPCRRLSECRTVKMWNDYYKLTSDFFDHITVAQLMERKAKG